MSRSTECVAMLIAAWGDCQYAGSEACKPCHPAQSLSQSKSGHARALAIARAGSPGQWAFGAGDQAITYVSQLDEDWYIEHGLSFYTNTKSMALTPGHKNTGGVRYRIFDPDPNILPCFPCPSTAPLAVGPGQRI